MALAALGDAYEQLDEQGADRLEETLFRPVQAAYGRASRTHGDFARRHGLPVRTFSPSLSQGSPHGVKDLLETAVDAVANADEELAALQDSLKPVEVGDPELRAGLAEVRRQLGDVTARARDVVRFFGR